MNYKVIPFKAQLSKAGTTSVATQLQNIIDQETTNTWQYHGMESVSTYVAGSNGCFGFGATQGYNTNVQVLVFKKTASF